MKPLVPNGSFCMACGANTSELHEYYMLTDEVWLKVAPDSRGMLCIQCVEAILGRKLTPRDFDFDWMDQFQGYRSDLLWSRSMGAGMPFTRTP